MSIRECPRIGDMTLCRVCNKAIKLLRSRNPHTGVDIDFWVHFASLDIKGPAETHKAIPKRSLWDYKMTRFGPVPVDDHIAHVTPVVGCSDCAHDLSAANIDLT